MTAYFAYGGELGMARQELLWEDRSRRVGGR